MSVSMTVTITSEIDGKEKVDVVSVPQGKFTNGAVVDANIARAISDTQKIMEFRALKIKNKLEL